MADGNIDRSGGLGESGKDRDEQPQGIPQQRPGGGQPYADQQGPTPQRSYGGPGGYVAPAYAAPTQRLVKSVGGATRVIGWGVLAVCIIAIIASIGAWISVKIDAGALGSIHVSANGFEHISSNSPSPVGDLSHSSGGGKDGWIVMIFAVITGILAVVRAFGKAAVLAAIAALISGILFIGVALYDINGVHRTVDEFRDHGVQFTSILVGWGLWLVLITGVVLTLLGIIGIVKRH